MTTTTRSTTAPTGPTVLPPGPTDPFAVPAASFAYLERSARALSEAITVGDVGLRYAHAHMAALRATAAMLAARARPDVQPRRRRPQRNAWVLLAEVAPELAEWAAFFSQGAAKRAAAASGARGAVTEREADDLVREADRFLAIVEESLGLAPHRPCVDRLARLG
ncbi:SAV_6107 family HEPN domain-containing protein [Nocardioides marmoribigeumensis]|uniref:SAV-6107-like HEPN domain-containing protein n=1 Tax=Nocardioides marmoribigeumensis TaxID=433649 RepID=A0ABU2BRP3_9ACTN|nr:SAV_6107 family HEPN domain-containing protein [Nocardioides marmoribigeumensis]MDR7361299.1 hypothetical protein [Nocardioides marmoribigeumensis]